MFVHEIYITDCLYCTVDFHIPIRARHFGWDIYLLHIYAESMTYAEVFWGFYELSFLHVILDENGTVRYSILKVLDNKCK